LTLRNQHSAFSLQAFVIPSEARNLSRRRRRSAAVAERRLL